MWFVTFYGDQMFDRCQLLLLPPLSSFMVLLRFFFFSFWKLP